MLQTCPDLSLNFHVDFIGDCCFVTFFTQGEAEQKVIKETKKCYFARVFPASSIKSLGKKKKMQMT